MTDNLVYFVKAVRNKNLQHKFKQFSSNSERDWNDHWKFLHDAFKDFTIGCRKVIRRMGFLKGHKVEGPNGPSQSSSRTILKCYHRSPQNSWEGSGRGKRFPKTSLKQRLHRFSRKVIDPHVKATEESVWWAIQLDCSWALSSAS